MKLKTLKKHKLTGFTNLGLKEFNYDKDGSKVPNGLYERSVGSGTTLEEALEKTIINFMENVTHYKNEKNSALTKDDFKIVDYDEF
ncbi:MAG: hypothetical protein ABF649_09355 [Bacillus sp. (in: firmicutes)]